MKLKALLIGCGKIGAEYDFDRPGQVWSHAKAYALKDNLELTVSDTDEDKARKVAQTYGARILSNPGSEEYQNFDIISIATPSITHFEYLKDILNHSSSVVICEKPAVSSSKQADELLIVYKSAGSKVLVNYMRRYQPAYELMKERLSHSFDRTCLRAINVKYCRGFLNNASHAVDLLEYLYDEPFDFRGFNLQRAEFDSFDYDPTLTGSCSYLDHPVSITGVSKIGYAVFEIEIFYADSKIVVCHSGDEIRYYVKSEGMLKENVQERQKAILDRYMVPVVDEALDLYFKRKIEDNFISALNVNKRMLEIIELIKKHNVAVSN